MTRDADERLDCPNCGQPSADIVYGLPLFGDEMRRDLADGRTVLGGCLLGFDDPSHHCLACHLDVWPDGRTSEKHRHRSVYRPGAPFPRTPPDLGVLSDPEESGGSESSER